MWSSFRVFTNIISNPRASSATTCSQSCHLLCSSPGWENTWEMHRWPSAPRWGCSRRDAQRGWLPGPDAMVSASPKAVPSDGRAHPIPSTSLGGGCVGKGRSGSEAGASFPLAAQSPLTSRPQNNDPASPKHHEPLPQHRRRAPSRVWGAHHSLAACPPKSPYSPASIRAACPTAPPQRLAFTCSGGPWVVRGDALLTGGAGYSWRLSAHSL